MEIVVPEQFRWLYVENDERPVVKTPAPVLRQVARPITKITQRHRLLADNMVRIMRQAYGIGLAAPQIGVSERLIVIAPEGRPSILFNPEIIRSEGTVVGEEGCLSIPGLYGDVERAELVEIRALTRKGDEITWELDGLAARVAQHEIDHLDGVLFTDKVDPATLHWKIPDGEVAPS